MVDTTVKYSRSVTKLTVEGNYAGALWYAERVVETLRARVGNAELEPGSGEEDDG